MTDYVLGVKVTNVTRCGLLLGVSVDEDAGVVDEGGRVGLAVVPDVAVEAAVEAALAGIG